MDHHTKSNIIIGSKLAMAVSNVIGSPFRAPLVVATGGRPADTAKMAKRCAALKSRSSKLLEVMKAQDARILSTTTRLKSAAGRKTTRRMTTMMGQMLEQQTSLHSKLETLLDQMLSQISGGKNYNS